MHQLRRIVACQVALIAAFLFIPQSVAHAADAPFAHRWGIVDGHLATGTPVVDGQLPSGDPLLKARSAGFGWARYILFWNLTNRARGEYDWTYPDVEIARLRAAGFNVLVTVMFAPAWSQGSSFPNVAAHVYCMNDVTGTAMTDELQCRNQEFRPGADPQYRTGYTPAGCSPTSPMSAGCSVNTNYPAGYDRSQDFRTFFTEVVRRYKGSVQAYSASVETNTSVFWRGTPAQLVDEVLRPAYDIVKAEDPGALVVGPEQDDEAAFQGMLLLERQRMASGQSKLFDVLSFHAHAHSGWEDPSRLETRVDEPKRDPYLPPDPSRGCSPVPAGQSLTSTTMCSISNIVERYGLGRPLWFTEMSFRTIYPEGTQPSRDWTSRWIAGINQRPWIDKAFLINLLHDINTGLGSYGLYYPDSNSTPVPIYDTITGALANQAPPRLYYLAEGATTWQFTEDVLVANPNATDAPVKLTFLKGDGSVQRLTATLAAKSRRTFTLNQIPGLASVDVSTVVESTLGLPLAVERTMSWDASGYGGHTGSAVDAPAKTWYFAEGSQGFFDTYVLLANSGNATANVTVTFLRESPDPPVTISVPVGPTKRETIWTGNDALFGGQLINKSFAIRVESDLPVIAERAMYFGAFPAPFWNGGHESAGVPALANEWFLAEGSTNWLFDEYILVGNPGDAPANVTFTFLLDRGLPPVVARTTTAMDPNSRLTVSVADASGLTILEGDAANLRNAAVSARVTADVPIVVERAMYWPKPASTWAEAHNSFGVTETGTRWGLAEGRIGGARGYETYILIANPTDQKATVRVTFLKPDGSTSSVTHDVSAQSRDNVWPWEMPAGEFGALVESLNGVEIVVERAMYWNGPGAPFWAAGTNATATKLP